MKQVEVQSGKYKGKLAVILGRDIEYLGNSVLSEDNEMGRDYYVRFVHYPEWQFADVVYIANIDGLLVALNKNELAKPKKTAEAPQQEAPKQEATAEKKGE